MVKKSKAQRREEAAEYYATHGIDEGFTEDDLVELEVRKPLNVILSLRLNQDDMEKLRLIAEAQNVGITTMARMLLHQSLTKPRSRPTPTTPQGESFRDMVAAFLGTPDAPVPEGFPDYLMLPSDILEDFRQWFERLNEHGIAISPERIKELQPKD